MLIVDSKGKERIICYKYKEVVNNGSTKYEPYGLRYVYNDGPIDPEFINILRGLSYIEFCPSFNYNIDNLPSNITSIVFPINSEFNQPINNLPNNLQHLELYDAFNQPLDYLPYGMKTLIINADFNHPLDNLPASLEHLQIRGGFNFPLNNLPQSLRKLEILDIYDYDGPSVCNIIQRNYGKKTMFNYPLINLPSNLEYLKITHKDYTHPIPVLH